jgi:hypothetical protein
VTARGRGRLPLAMLLHQWTALWGCNMQHNDQWMP